LFSTLSVKRLSDTELLTIVGRIPDIRQKDFNVTAGTYTVNRGTPLEFDIITRP
jgi:hypothetical protein